LPILCYKDGMNIFSFRAFI